MGSTSAELSSSENNISSLFFRSAAAYPAHTAIIHGEEAVSYAQLERSVQQTAAWLQSKGIGAGDRVLVFVPMTIELYRVVLAIFSIGATAVFLDEWVSLNRLELCCAQAGCKAFIGGWKARLLFLVSSELRRIPVRLGLTYPKHKEADIQPVDLHDTALITFTTGSTGKPKAARRTHGFLHEQFRALTEVIGPRPGEVDMPTLPIVLLLNLGAGATSVVPTFKPRKPATLKPEVIHAEILRHQVSRITASPYFVQRMADYVISHKAPLKHLRRIFTGGAAVFPADACRLSQAFPDADIHIVYGSTEAEPVSLISAGRLCGSTSALLPVGDIYRGIEVRIIPITEDVVRMEEGMRLEALCLPHGQVGEIIVSGPHVLTEYWNNAEAFRQHKIVDGVRIWHRTGDAGAIDAHGQLFLAGRCKEVIPHSSGPVYPFLFESYVRSLPGVSLGTVLLLDGKLTAIVELTGQPSAAAIEAHLRSSHFPIEGIRFLKHIPRDPRHFSKIDYGRLREEIGG